MPTLAAQLSLERFAPLVNESFTLRANDKSEFSIQLSAVRGLGWNVPKERGGQESFALLFRAPPTADLVQGIHLFTHPAIGSHPLFLVPVSRDAEGLSLEVIFNFA